MSKKIQCEKCKDTGWFKYDRNHSSKCDECCKHDMGWWLLKDHYGDDNGKLCCLAGCGTKKEVQQSPGTNWDEVLITVTHTALKKHKWKLQLAMLFMNLVLSIQ